MYDVSNYGIDQVVGSVPTIDRLAAQIIAGTASPYPRTAAVSMPEINTTIGYSPATSQIAQTPGGVVQQAVEAVPQTRGNAGAPRREYAIRSGMGLPTGEAPMKETNLSLRDILKEAESSGDYSAKNKYGYLGAYQFGKAALQDLGYKDKSGKWTGKDGINSEQEFLSTPSVQEKAFGQWVTTLDKQLDSRGTSDLTGTTINGEAGRILVTQDGLRAASHLVGSKAVHDWLSGKRSEPKDGNGVYASEYMQKVL